MSNKTIIVIGGGASGFFAAINLAERKPNYKILILEKSNKLLSKVRISGGGRCNVTNHTFDNRELVKNYPRGHKELLQVFSKFNPSNTIEWFREHGVKLKTEADGRMFPISNSSETIVQCFLELAHQLNIEIRMNCAVLSIERSEESKFIVITEGQELKADHVICAAGGFNKPEAYTFLKKTGHSIVPPIPSLFTLNLPDTPIKKELQGVAVQNTMVRIAGTKLQYTGPVLITHWGLSGPAVLKLSAFAAEAFYKSDYKANIQVNWLYPVSVAECMDQLLALQTERPKAYPFTSCNLDIPKRLWEYLLREAGIDNSRCWAEIGKKQMNKLSELLCNSQYEMRGKTTFKEEFVTCGGIDLKEIDFRSMESKLMPGLFFTGEILNIDGITGGFNFQAAWSTAWLCANAIT